MKMIFRELYLFSPHEKKRGELNLKTESMLLLLIRKMVRIEENLLLCEVCTIH